jgi:hypothetical protein
MTINVTSVLNGTAKRNRKPKKLRISFRLKDGKENQDTVDWYFPTGDYKKVQTSGSVRFENNEVSLNFGTRFVGPGLMLLIGKVRSEVQKNFKEDAISPVLVSPEYFKLGEIDRKSAAVEVDLSKAYLTAAFKIGAISQKTYDRLNECAKTTRLMVIGSLATKRVISHYQNGVKVSTEVEQSQEMLQVWRWIVAEVDKTMREVAASLGKGFMYYWCDAAFVKASHVAAAQEAMKAKGYESKQKTTTAMRCDGKKVYLLDGRIFPARKGFVSPELANPAQAAPYPR